jgi:Uma2 family endonuclease
LTIADIEDIDPTVGRIELIDGNLILTPSADLEHQDLCLALVNWLNVAAPPGLRAYSAINVYEPGTDKVIFIPDVAVLDPTMAVFDGRGVLPDALALVIEITSSNRETDLGVKKDRYMQWGVPYLVVDRKPVTHEYKVFGDLPEWVAGITGAS